MTTVQYAARAPQWAMHVALNEARWVVAVCHRRMGKTVAAVNELIRGAATNGKIRPRYAYIAPTYKQAKAVAWDYLKQFGLQVPGAKANEVELRVDFPTNGGQVRLYGADNPDSLRGIYLDGAVLDEYGMMSPALIGEVLRPALADRQGWMLICGTPTGDRHFAEIADLARRDPEYRYVEFKASQTGLVPPGELESARKLMTEDEFAQEFECSWNAAVRGAVYGKELESLRAKGQITRVPYDSALPVDTDWDLGMADSMSIWFTQSLRTGEVRVIDYYENMGEGIPHYIQVLRDRGYVYGRHWAPHDITVREMSSGRSRKDTAASLGLEFDVVEMAGIKDGIHAARMLLPRCWFDEERCKVGLEALKHYRREWRDRLQTHADTPLHDWSSHAADSFRGLAVRHRTPEERRPKVRIIDLGRGARGGTGWMR